MGAGRSPLGNFLLHSISAGSGAPLLQPTAPSVTERAGAIAGRTGMPGEAQIPTEHPSQALPYTPRMLSHSHGCSFPQPCSSTQGSLSLVVAVTGQPRLVPCTQHNRGSKLNEILQ